MVDHGFLDLLDAFPLQSFKRGRAGATVVVLGVEAGVDAISAVPRQPAVGIDQIVEEGLHDDGSREILPWPADVRFNDLPDGVVGGVGDDGAVLEDDSCGLAHTGPALGGDDVGLVAQRLSDDESAVLEDASAVAEDEVDGAGDDTVTVELAVGVGVKRVLVTIHLTVVEDDHVGSDAEGHRLVFFRPGGVLKPNVFGHEKVSKHNCITVGQTDVIV
ncbi:hypothetical protein U1Q18_004273 [Sarracenia purpurea var. burkii]